MNKSKHLILMLICGVCATFMTTSCLNSDDDNNLTSTMTREDSIESVMRANGSYTGELIYAKSASNSTTGRNDSVAVSWNIEPVSSTQAKLTMSGFPVSVLSSYLTSSTIGDSPSDILASAQAQPYNTYCVPYSKVATTSTTQYGYLIYPKEPQMSFTVDFNGATHNIVITFANYLQSYSSYPYYAIAIKAGNSLEGNIIVSSVKVDDMEYKVGTLLYFHGVKVG